MHAADLPGRSTLLDLLVHLRLHFQLLLAPIYLWGIALAGGGLDWRVGLGFVVLHVFLYGGVTAFNSAYDRDEGPVGGLERPPPVSPALLPFAVGVKLVGMVLAFALDAIFGVAYALVALLSVGYSHPRIRFKARPGAALAVVGVGQGVLPFLGAWALARGEIISAASTAGVLGAAAGAGLVLGFYPLTQLFQVEEDRARGDRSVAVAWGTDAAFCLSLVCLVLGGTAMVTAVAVRWNLVEAAVLGVALLGLVAAVAAWAARFDPRQVLANYRAVMRLNGLAALGFGSYMMLKLLT